MPTGGVTQVLEVISIVLALQLMANRDQVWLPRRWRTLDLGSDKEARLLTGLLNGVRRLERVSRPRLRMAFDHRISNIVFGTLVIAGSLGAFLAPSVKRVHSSRASRIRHRPLATTTGAIRLC